MTPPIVHCHAKHDAYYGLPSNWAILLKDDAVRRLDGKRGRTPHARFPYWCPKKSGPVYFHLVVALDVDLAVAVDLALGVAVDAGQPAGEVHVGHLPRVGVAVQEVLVVGEGLAPGGRSLHQPAEVHGGARAPVMAGRALGDGDPLRERETAAR